jgi:hypothetical protein
VGERCARSGWGRKRRGGVWQRSDCRPFLSGAGRGSTRARLTVREGPDKAEPRRGGDGGVRAAREAEEQGGTRGPTREGKSWARPG